MSGDLCLSCGYRIPAALRTGGGGAVRCPRCGDAVPAEDGATVTKVHEPEVPSTLTQSPESGGTVDYEPGRTLPGSSTKDSAAQNPLLPNIPGYQLLEVVGRGGMGVVYKAYQLSPRRLVALKMILGVGGRPERFRAEVAAVARLQHANVVQIHEVGEVGGRPYFSMEYVPGGSLSQQLRNGPLPTQQAAEVVGALARAVQHAHERGIVHRDLKPGNILISTERGTRDAGSKEAEQAVTESYDSTQLSRRLPFHPKIADFGLAKHLEGSADGAGPLTQSGAILGTPNYMAPEQAKGKVKEIGPGVDIWALGAILYECLTGRPPFQEDSHLDTMMKVISEDPQPLRQLRSAVPRDLEVICLKCLRKDPKERYKSAGELAEDLERFLEGQPIKARSRTVRERVGGWVRRRRNYVFMAAGAALIAGLAFVALDWGRKQGNAPVPPDEPDDLAGLPPDLRLVPSDALAFATIRAADLWTNPASRELVDHIASRNTGPHDDDMRLDSLGGQIEKFTTIHPTNVERATFVLVGEKGDQKFMIILATREPYLHEKLRIALALGKKHEQPQPVGSNGLQVYDPINRDRDMAFLPYNENVLVLGDAALVFRSASPSGRPSSLLTPMLRRAAEGHTFVVGAQPPAGMVAEVLAKPFNLGVDTGAVAALRALGVVADLSHPAGPNGTVTVDLATWVTYPTGEKAETARPHMRKLVGSLCEQLLENERILPTEFLATLTAPVKAAEWEREEETLHASARLSVDVAAVKSQFDQMSQQQVSRSNMWQLTRAMQEYHSKHGRFPPAVVTDADGKPLYSWRVLILPHIRDFQSGASGDALYRRFHLNRAWDHPSNKPLLDQMPAVFGEGRKGGTTTHYQVLTGAGGVFDSPEGRSLTEITDGTARTILFVEAPDQVPWTAPSDVAFSDFVPKLNAAGRSGFQAALADGIVRYLPTKSTPEAQLRATSRGLAGKQCLRRDGVPQGGNSRKKQGSGFGGAGIPACR